MIIIFNLNWFWLMLVHIRGDKEGKLNPSYSFPCIIRDAITGRHLSELKSSLQYLSLSLLPYIWVSLGTLLEKIRDFWRQISLQFHPCTRRSRGQSFVGFEWKPYGSGPSGRWKKWRKRRWSSSSRSFGGWKTRGLLQIGSDRGPTRRRERKEGGRRWWDGGRRTVAVGSRSSR